MYYTECELKLKLMNVVLYCIEYDTAYFDSVEMLMVNCK